MKRKRHGCSNHFKFKISLEWCCFPLIKRYAELWYIPWSIQVHQLSVCPSKLHQHLRPGLWMAPMHVVLHKCPLLSQPPEILRRFSVSSFSWCPKDVLRVSRFSRGCADWIGIRRTWYDLIMLDPSALATATLYHFARTGPTNATKTSDFSQQPTSQSFQNRTKQSDISWRFWVIFRCSSVNCTNIPL